MSPRSVIVIGAGIGGLVAAALLSAAGLQVTVCEAMAEPGGKLHEAMLPGAAIDAGPTLFTLRPVFERIFAEAGARLERHLALQRLDCLARHFWADGSRLDLFDDPVRNESAIRDFAGPKAADGYARFRQRAKRTFETLDDSFMRVPQPGLYGD